MSEEQESGLDYFAIQATFSGDDVEITFVEDAMTSEDASVISTIRVAIGDDPEFLSYVEKLQTTLNELIVRGYQTIRDSHK